MQPDKLRIIHVFRAPLGGLFRHVVDLACEQSARGHEVGMFFDQSGMCERVEKALASVPGGLKLGFATCPIARNPGPSDIGAFLAFSRSLREKAPDVVHGHGSKGGLFSRLSGLARSPGDPIRAYTPHGGSFNYKPGSLAFRIYMAAERIMAPRTDVFLFESDNIRQKFDAYVGGKTGLQRVVVNGLGAAEFEPAVPAADAADILYVGELREAKGIDVLIEALARVAAMRGVAPSACLVGSGPDRDALIRRARALGLADRIVFPGPMPIREAFRRGRIMVVPSRAESMPYVVLEGAAAKMPLVVTDVGGIPEIFGPYRDRLGPSDDPEDLARRICEQLNMNPADRGLRAAELSHYVRNAFSIDSMANSVLGAYRDAISLRTRQTVAAPAAASTFR